MIRHIPFAEINRTAWDKCITDSGNGLIYAYSWFLDIACERWDALVEDDYLAVMPLPWRKKYGVRYVYPPFFVQQLGVFSTSPITKKQVEGFINAVPQIFGFAEIMFNSDNIIDQESLNTTIRLNHLLDLSSNYDLIRSNYSENLVRNLRKAEKAGLKIDTSVRPDQIITIFKENKGKEISKLKDEDYNRLLKIIFAAAERGLALVLGVSDTSGNSLGGCVLLKSFNRWIFFFSAVTAQAKEKAAMPFIIDCFINENSGRNLIFDFEGSNNPNLARFYKSFGAHETVYHLVTLNRLPFISKTVYNFSQRRKKD